MASLVVIVLSLITLAVLAYIFSHNKGKKEKVEVAIDEDYLPVITHDLLCKISLESLAQNKSPEWLLKFGMAMIMTSMSDTAKQEAEFYRAEYSEELLEQVLEHIRKEYRRLCR